MSDAGQPTVTVTMSVPDWQLVMHVLQQALLPYQRLGQVMQDMQRQSLQQQGHAPATRADIPTQQAASNNVPPGTPLVVNAPNDAALQSRLGQSRNNPVYQELYVPGGTPRPAA